MVIDQSSDLPKHRRWPAIIGIAIVLLIAAGVRMCGLVSQSYVLDEDWSLEIATGRGSLHLNLPVDQIITPPPPFYSWSDAPPWWHIWTHMEVTHPPLYPILLRWWVDLVGDTDNTGRLFSVLAAIAGIGLLIDAVRLQAGITPAIWAGLLMAVATPQVDYSRLTRSYTFLIAIALLAANILTRIQVLGPTRRRWILLTVAVLATLMTHYFCLGAIVGLMVYGLVALPKNRRQILTVFCTAGLIFLLAWGPWMWRQRHLFATDDPSTIFLTGDQTNHSLVTFMWTLAGPLQLLFPHSGLGVTGTLSLCGGAALFLVPLIPNLRKKNPFLLMWGLWLIGTIGVISFLDFTRGTEHLRFVRYTLLAGPATYALIPCLFATFNRWKGAMHLASGLTLISCLINLPDVYLRPQIEPRTLVSNLITRPGPRDLFIIAAPPSQTIICKIHTLLLARYLQPTGCQIAILTKPAGPEILNAVQRSGGLIFLDIQDADYHGYVPDAIMVCPQQQYHGLGNVFTLQYGSNGK